VIRFRITIVVLVVLLGGCIAEPPPPVAVEMPAETVSFLEDVKPILDGRCVVCHSCYNAACQLKLSSYEGLARYQELFIDAEWLDTPHRVALGDVQGANPFLIYAQIPPASRYRFLLDDAEYFIRTFIRGPVCKGQIALYDRTMPEGFDLDAVWKGRRATDAPFLTVYRHFDSASVHRGAIGDLPRTAWMIDYSKFERIYYALVAGFDVFGNLSHQVNVRRYMDLLRVEGEFNFVELLPRADRLPIIYSWYLGDRAAENASPERLLTDRETRIEFQTDDPKRELLERIVDEHLLRSLGIEFDQMNFQRRDDETPVMPKVFETHADVVDGFRALTAPGTEFIKLTTSRARM